MIIDYRRLIKHGGVDGLREIDFGLVLEGQERDFGNRTFAAVKSHLHYDFAGAVFKISGLFDFHGVANDALRGSPDFVRVYLVVGH